jgi:uncharacterized protein YcbX
MSIGEVAGRVDAVTVGADTPASAVNRVTALATTPVKGLHLLAPSEVMLGEVGVAENRAFYLIDERNKLVNGKRVGILSAVHAVYDPATARLTLCFPDGTVASDELRAGAAIETRFFSRRPTAWLVEGPWSEALSDYAGQPLRLVRADPQRGGIDRGREGAVSLISSASVQRLEAIADGRTVDPRRFRMLIEVTGPHAHEEDEWVGRPVRIGRALVAMRGHVGRCLVTSQDPDSGVVDLPTLELLGYRRGLPTTEPLAFGVYGEVLEPGIVSIGDPVAPA